jgi:hypothetical protein
MANLPVYAKSFFLILGVIGLVTWLYFSNKVLSTAEDPLSRNGCLATTGFTVALISLIGFIIAIAWEASK